MVPVNNGGRPGAMAHESQEASTRFLDPIDRISEIFFGLIMVLTSTGTLSVLSAGRAEVKTMVLGALGCNLAWGIIDAGMYLMGSLEERGRNILMLRAVRQSTSSETAKRAIEDALPESLASALSPDDLGNGQAEAASASGNAQTSPFHERRLVRRVWRLPAGFHIDVSCRHSFPFYRRRLLGATGFQRGCDRHAVPVRLCVWPLHRPAAVANRTCHGRRWRRAGWRRDSTRRIDRPRRRRYRLIVRAMRVFSGGSIAKVTNAFQPSSRCSAANS